MASRRMAGVSLTSAMPNFISAGKKLSPGLRSSPCKAAVTTTSTGRAPARERIRRVGRSPCPLRNSVRTARAKRGHADARPAQLAAQRIGKVVHVSFGRRGRSAKFAIGRNSPTNVTFKMAPFLRDHRREQSARQPRQGNQLTSMI